jgi:hypothetical protein
VEVTKDIDEVTDILMQAGSRSLLFQKVINMMAKRFSKCPGPTLAFLPREPSAHIKIHVAISIG